MKSLNFYVWDVVTNCTHHPPIADITMAIAMLGMPSLEI